MNDTLPSDEIDLLKLIQTIWDGKWKILAISAAFAAGIFGFQSIRPKPHFIATVEIKPISSKEEDKYSSLNSLELFQIKKEDLMKLFSERLIQPETLAKVFREQKLLSKEEFTSEGEYEFAVKALAGSVNVLSPINAEGSAADVSRRNWTLTIRYNDKDKWLAALSQLNKLATREVLEIITQRFRKLVHNAKVKRKFELEDISTQIENIMVDYDTLTSDRLAFLSEQALIARKLGVAKNTIEAQTFSVQNGVVASVKTDTPFYLRGFEAIEKEIELISSRKDKSAFVIGLRELEQKKRSLEQDKVLQRAEALFAETPLTKASEFRAAHFAIESTVFDLEGRPALMLALGTVFGGMIGIVYILIASAMRGRTEGDARQG